MGTHPAFFLTDQKGDWCHVDPGWQALTGTTDDQALGVGWQSFIHPQERQRVVAAWQAGILTQARFSLTYLLAHREGRYRSVHHVVSPSPAGYMGSLTLKAVEPEAKDQSLDLLDLMFAHSLEALFLMMMDQPLEWHDGIDKEAALDYAMTHQHLVRVNGAMAEQYGCTAVELLGQTPADLFAHDLDYGRQIFREFLDAGWLGNETQERRVDGSLILIQGNYVCLYDSQGRIVGHFGTQREVTEQKKKENDYRHQALLMQKILDATPNAVYIFDLSSYQDIYANPRVLCILGYTPEEVMALGSSLLVDHIHPEDLPHVQLHLGQCLEMDDQKVAEIEYRFQRRDGSWCWLNSREVVFARNDSGQVQQILGVLQDITERQIIALALNESEARLSQLLDNLPVIVYRYVMDPDGRDVCTYISSTAASIFEVAVPDGLASLQTIWNRVHPEDFPWMASSIQVSAQTLQTWQADYRLLMPDGRIKWVSSRSTPQRQQDGSIVWDGITIEITERKQAEIALAASENRFDNLAANVPGAIFQYVLHQDGTDQVIYMSQGCLAIWEVEAAAVEVEAKILWEMVHPDDREAMFTSVLTSARSLEPWQWSWRILTPSGQLKWLEASGRPRRLDNGDILWGSLIVDVTTRKLGDLALEASQRQFQSLVENSPDIIERFDLDLKHLYVSSTLVKTTGIAADDFIGKTCRDLQMDPKMVDCFEKATEQALATGQTQRIEFTTHTANGIREFEMSVSPEQNSEGSIESFLCISRDVTAYKEATAALSASKRQLQSLITNLPGALLQCLNDRDYTALYISEGVVAITGYTAEDFISGRIHLGSLIDPLDEPRVWHVISNGIEVSNFYEVEYKITTQNGDCKWVLDRGQGIYDETGALLYLETFISDITNLKLAELSLQQQVLREQTLNRVIRSIRDSLDLDTIFATATHEVGIILTLQSCVIVRYEPELKVWRHLTEYLSTPEQLSFINVDIPDEGNPFSTQLKHQQIVQFKSMDIIDDVNRDLLQDFQGSWLLVPIVVEGLTWGSFSLYRQDPSPSWTEETIRLAQAITDQLAIGIQQAQLHHQLQALNQSLISTVEKRTAQLQKAFEAESLLRHITEQVRNSLDEDVILKTVVDTLGERLSLLFCNICTYNDDAVFPRYVFQRTHLPLPQLILPMREYSWVYDTLRLGHTTYFSTRLEELWVTLFIAPVQDDLCALGDILVMRMGHESFQPSEIRLVEQVANQCSIALRQSRLFTAVQDQVKELNRLNHLKDDFLSTVSHELRSPMANIKMATRMLEVNLERITTPPNVQQYMQILQEEGDREINLINDLLDLARLEADTPQLNLSKMDLSELIQKLILPLEARFKTQQQRFDVQISHDVPLITTDVTYLERILGELLHNACKYTPAGETILIDIQTNSTLQIQVINTGVEIPAHEYDRIFDKFYRVPHNDPWKHGGTGLGLALVERMVKALGGKIEVSSSNNSTCFDVSLPLL